MLVERTFPEQLLSLGCGRGLGRGLVGSGSVALGPRALWGALQARAGGGLFLGCLGWLKMKKPSGEGCGLHSRPRNGEVGTLASWVTRDHG